MKDLSQKFIIGSRDSREYQEALRIITENNKGNAWLIGGFLFRTLASELYDTPKPPVDLDFIVEKPLANLRLPADWKATINHFGNLKLSGPNFTIDFVPLENIFSIKERGLEPTITNFLSGVPLTIQSLALNVGTGELLGEAGIQALVSKTVGAHNHEQAKSYAQRYQTTVEAYVQDKAASLGFKPVLPT